MGEHLIVLCTSPDETVARRLAERLVDDQLAACVNILPSVTSVYRWQGKREKAQEVMMLIKTIEGLYTRVEETIRELHPYELPEVIGVPIGTGLPPYLEWISNCCGRE